ncbi:carbonic anhydrase [Rhizobium sp. 57MFTsu3.2]|nr:carbonic anhydrase [Rhizobium sp. 57MFTsu3.2]
MISARSFKRPRTPVRTVEIAYRYQEKDVGVRPRPPDATTALSRLIDGNRAFADLLDSVKDEGTSARRVVQVDARDLGLASGMAEAPSQRPFAAVLGCSDARVPLELIFNEGPNDLFVIRVAGNGLGSDVLGSLKYAVEHLGGTLKLIVVLGHSGCGAVSAAVDVFLNPGMYLSLVDRHSLREILDRLLVVVHVSAQKLQAAFGPDILQRAGYRQALIETSVVVNAALAACSAQQEIETQGELRVVYGVYLLETRRVWTPSTGHPDGVGLAPAPRDVAEFQQLGDAIVGSSRVTALLGA